MWGEIELNQKQTYAIKIIGTIIVLILLNFLFLLLADGILLIIMLIILIHIIAIRFLIFHLKYWKNISNLDDNLIKSFSKKNCKIILLVCFILFLILSYPYIFLYSTYDSEQSQLELKELVDDIISGLIDNENKTLAILRWFDRGVDKQENISNIYYRFNQDDVFVLLYSRVPYEGLIYSKYPYFGFRLPDTTGNWHNWIYHTRIGRCGEYSRLFSMMCYYANLTVREVSCIGEDHDWNEVWIGNDWVVIDPTTVNLPCRNGYDIPRDFMENKVKGDLNREGICVDKGNVSYVYALYPNNLDDEVDITNRYTDVINITVKVVDNNKQPLEGVKIKVFSHNRLKKRDTSLSNTTNVSGISIFRIGGGDYTFEASFNNIVISTRDSYDEDILEHTKNITFN